MIQPPPPRPARALRILLGSILALGSAACFFDDSAVQTRNACRDDRDCIRGTCEYGLCTTDEPQPRDAGGRDDDTLRLDVRVATDTTDATSANDIRPADVRPDATCGQTNACGGCGPLPDAPGARCGDCGVWVCNDQRTLTCDGDRKNACGGCTTLTGTPGQPCGGACDSTWSCSGSDRVVCTGGENLCGGCGDLPAVPGSDCSCPAAPGDDADWKCDTFGGLACEDGNDQSPTAIDLGQRADTDTTLVTHTSAIHRADDVDFLILDGIDEVSSSDGLFPVASMQSVHPVNFCAWWRYSDRRNWSPVCSTGSNPAILGDFSGCCMRVPLREATIRITRVNNAGGRLDELDGRGNDNGTLLIRLESTPGAARCAGWQVSAGL